MGSAEEVQKQKQYTTRQTRWQCRSRAIRHPQVSSCPSRQPQQNRAYNTTPLHILERTAEMLVFSSRIRRQLRASASGVWASWLALISLMRRLCWSVGVFGREKKSAQLNALPCSP